MTAPVVQIDGAEKLYKGRAVLGPVDFAAAAGERVALVGPSGSGKSTLLRSVLGLVPIDRGRISVFGETLSDRTLADVRLRTGYVIQDGGLFPHLTARANVALRARHLGWSSDRIDARMKELGAVTRLSEAELGRYPGELSGGQRQRVGIARALLLDPPLLLLDEPLGALDPLVRASLQKDLLDIATSGNKTMLLVTHDLAEAARLATRIVLLKIGKLEQVGTADDLLHRPASDFVRDFVSAQRGFGA